MSLGRIAVAAGESFLMLRRNRIFLATFAVGLIVFSFANISSNWGNMEFEKILYYFSAYAYIMLGVLVTTVWGAQMIKAGDGAGSQDIPLATALTRSELLIGRFLGIVSSMVLIGACFISIIQVNMLLNDYPWLTGRHLLIFAYLTVIWLVCSATTIFLRTFCSATLTTILSLVLFVIAMISGSIAKSLKPETGTLERVLFEGLAKVWNFQRFNLTDSLFEPARLSTEQLLSTAAYGLSLTCVLIAAGVIAYRHQDL